MIDPEGIEALCSDLEVEHTDVRILMLAWKMKAEKQGYFILEEWRRGLKALRADTVNKLKKALPELEKEVKRPLSFVDFYSYAFRYCLTEEKQKSIDIESICELLNIVLGSEYPSQVELFIEYLKIQNDYKVINLDQWMGFYRFCNEGYQKLTHQIGSRTRNRFCFSSSFFKHNVKCSKLPTLEIAFLLVM
jgi:DCN1-like protein 4/5